MDVTTKDQEDISVVSTDVKKLLPLLQNNEIYLSKFTYLIINGVMMLSETFLSVLLNSNIS